MEARSTLVTEGRATLLLALPLMAGQVSQMLIAMVDALMIGRLGTVPLAASTFAISLQHLPFMLGLGFTIAVSVKVSQARGANRPVDARAALRHGFFLCLALGVVTILASLLFLPALQYFRQDPEVVKAMPHYFLLLAVSLTPAMGSMVVKNHADAMDRPWTPFFILFGGVFLNVFLNWILIYGNLGVPAMGLDGAGWATLLARTSTLVGLLWWSLKAPDLREWIPHRWFVRPDPKALRSIFKIALPASVQVSCEIGAFVLAAIMIGSISAASLAGHQIAINCAGMTFMVPLGLSMALTVQMGEAFGAERGRRFRPIIVSGWLMGLAFSLSCAVCFFIFREGIAQWFVTDPETISIATDLLLIAALFQLVDHSQVLSAGSLRGLDDVKVPAWITFFSHWMIGMPLGWFLAFRSGMGAEGIWWGLTCGLALSAVFLSFRGWKKTNIHSHKNPV